MARIGLGADWNCLFANDIDSHKANAYRANFGAEHFHEADIRLLSLSDLPSVKADLAWASFPCQDLSLAGARSGLEGERSGLFFSFWKLMRALKRAKRAPKIIVLENVTGFLTSNSGKDFDAVVTTMARSGYAVAALVVDASVFVPQSRKRVFLFGFEQRADPLFKSQPTLSEETPVALLKAVDDLSPAGAKNWKWLSARPDTMRNTALVDALDLACEWHSEQETQQLVASMSERQKNQLDAFLASNEHRTGAAFKRVRIVNGQKKLRVEARFDDIAGCLRTPAGGSSRQLIFDVRAGRVRSRWMTPREAARLMGLPEDYVLPSGQTAALKLSGDGVCVPVVSWIREAILEPALAPAAIAA